MTELDPLVAAAEARHEAETAPKRGRGRPPGSKRPKMIAKPITEGRLTPLQWVEAEVHWESGEFTAEELAQKFGVTRSAVVQHMQQKGVRKGSKVEEYKERVMSEIAKQSNTDAIVTAQRIRETKDQHYKMAEGLAKLGWAEVVRAKTDNAPFSSLERNLKALNGAMDLMAKARIERYAVLGLVDGEKEQKELSQLVIKELTADQIEELRNREHELDEELGVHDDNTARRAPQTTQTDDNNSGGLQNDQGQSDDDDDDAIVEEK